MRAIQRFGKQLQQLRTRRSLTQEQLAVTAGLSRAFLTRLELGQHDPSFSSRASGVKFFFCVYSCSHPPKMM